MTATRTGQSTFEHPIGVDGLIVVRLRSGDVRIHGRDGDRALVSTRDGRSIDDLDIATGERTLSMGAGPGGRGAAHRGRHGGRVGSVELDLAIPTGASVVIESESADIEASGLAGDQRYTTGSGDVTLRDVTGTLAVEAVSGDVDVAAVGSASASLRAVSGDVTLIAGTLTRAEIGTTSGDIEIAARFDGDGPFRIETVSGDTRLAPANDVRVEMDTISGDLSSRLGSLREDRPGRRVLVVGHGGPTIIASSTSGDVRVDRERVTLAIKGRPTTTTAADTGTSDAGRQETRGLGVGDDRATDTPDDHATDTPDDRATDTPDALATPDIADGDDLVILRALERGEIDTAEAGRRLAALDDSRSSERDDA